MDAAVPQEIQNIENNRLEYHIISGPGRPHVSSRSNDASSGSRFPVTDCGAAAPRDTVERGAPSGVRALEVKARSFAEYWGRRRWRRLAAASGDMLTTAWSSLTSASRRTALGTAGTRRRRRPPPFCWLNDLIKARAGTTCRGRAVHACRRMVRSFNRQKRRLLVGKLIVMFFIFADDAPEDVSGHGVAAEQKAAWDLEHAGNQVRVVITVVDLIGLMEGEDRRRHNNNRQIEIAEGRPTTAPQQQTYGHC